MIAGGIPVRRRPVAAHPVISTQHLGPSLLERFSRLHALNRLQQSLPGRLQPCQITVSYLEAVSGWLGTVEMPSRDSLSKGELVALTGATSETLTVWMRHDIIVPEQRAGGKGNHAKYPYYEANIAAIMLHLRELGCGTDAMKGITAIYRDAIAWGARNNLTFEDVVVLQRLISGMKELEQEAGDGEVSRDALDRMIERLKLGVNGYFKLTDRILDFAYDGLDSEEYFRHSQAFLEVTLQPLNWTRPYPTYFWRSAEGWKRGDGKLGQLLATFDGVFASIVLDVVSILYRVWVKPGTQADDIYDIWEGRRKLGDSNRREDRAS